MKTTLVGTLVLVLSMYCSAAVGEGAETEEESASLSTVIIYTPRIRFLADFYREGLRFPEPATVLDNHIGFWLGDNYVAFEPAGERAGRPGRVSAWFEVADIEQAYARLRELGAAEHSAPERQSWGGVHATVLDPDGNLLGLIQSAENR